MASFLALKTASGLRPRSVEWYEERLRPILGALGPLPSHQALLEYLLAWKASRQPSVAHYRGILLALRTYLGHHGLELGIPLPRVPRYEGDRLSAPEVALLLARARRKPRGARDYAILAVLLDAGLRASELTGLTWEDVDLERGRLAISGKGGRRRYGYVGEVATDALDIWRRAHPGGEHVFCTAVGRPITRRNLYRIVLEAGKKAGFRLHPHMLRRTFATQWVRSGGNMLALQRLLGHSSLEMVRRYVWLAETDLILEGRRGILDGLGEEGKKR